MYWSWSRYPLAEPLGASTFLSACPGYDVTSGAGLLVQISATGHRVGADPTRVPAAVPDLQTS